MPTQGVLRMSHRAERLIECFASAEIDLLLVTALVNVRYLTGYSGSNGLALIGPQTRVFVTDFRYIQQARVEVVGSDEQRHDQLELLVGAVDLDPGLLDVAKIGHEHPRLRADQGEPVATAVSGQIADVDQCRDEQQIDLGRGEALDQAFGAVAHAENSLC